MRGGNSLLSPFFLLGHVAPKGGGREPKRSAVVLRTSINLKIVDIQILNFEIFGKDEHRQSMKIRLLNSSKS